MQEEITTPTLGTVRARACSRCSGRNGKTMRRSHTYLEYRTHGARSTAFGSAWPSGTWCPRMRFHEVVGAVPLFDDFRPSLTSRRSASL
jgi:hypothetical protein